MKKINKWLKSNSTLLFIILHIISISICLCLGILKYDWIIQRFDYYWIFVACVAPIGGLLLGTFYFIFGFLPDFFYDDEESEDNNNEFN